MRVWMALMALAMLASTASAQERPVRATFDNSVAGVTEGGRFDLSRLNLAAAPIEAQAPSAQRPAPPAPPPPAPTRRRRGSMVGYIEDATVESKIRVRFDTAYHDTAPDRAEFFYAKCGCYRDVPTTDPAFDPDSPGPRPGAANDVNFQQLDVWGEYAIRPGISIFGQLPVRWLQPQSFIPGTGAGFPDHSGIGDIRAGARFAAINAEDHSLTIQGQFFLPSGDAENGMGTDHASLEPEVLYFRQLTDIVTLESQFGVWIPFGGAAGLLVAQWTLGVIGSLLPAEAEGRRVAEVHRQEADDRGRREDREDSLPEDREVRGQQSERRGRAEQLEPEHRVRHTVVEPGHAHGLLVDHGVQAVHIQARRTCHRPPVQCLPGKTPERALDVPLGGRRPDERRTFRPLVRELDRQLVVAP